MIIRVTALSFILLVSSLKTSRNRAAAILKISASVLQGHPTDRFGGISVRETCNRLKFSVREMSSRAFLIKIN